VYNVSSSPAPGPATKPSPEPTTRDGKSPARPILLVVDDDASVREAYHLILDDEFTMLEAEEGQTAVSTVRAQRVDLVVLDVLMPGVDGIEILQELRALRPDLPVIMVTAMRTVRSAVAAMKLGALDYLTKPFDEEELLATIRRALDPRARRALVRAHHSQHDDDAQQPQPHRILLVGGDPGWRAVLAVALQRLAGVEVAETPVAGFDRALTLLPTCVLLRGDHSSAATARFLRAVHIQQPACISFLVGADVTEDAMPEGGMPNIRGVIASPTAFGEVVARVADVLGAPARSDASRLPFSDTVSRALDYIGKHYGESLTVQHLARSVGASASHLAHLFVSETGMTVRDYLARVRVVIAQELLEHTNQKVATIATSAGFFDTSHLARVLQKVTGRPPRAYRQSGA